MPKLVKGKGNPTHHRSPLLLFHRRTILWIAVILRKSIRTTKQVGNGRRISLKVHCIQIHFQARKTISSKIFNAIHLKYTLYGIYATYDYDYCIKMIRNAIYRKSVNCKLHYNEKLFFDANEISNSSTCTLYPMRRRGLKYNCSVEKCLLRTITSIAVRPKASLGQNLINHH